MYLYKSVLQLYCKSNILNLTANLSEKIQYEKNGYCVLSFSNAL